MEEFIASASFVGGKPGYMFKKGAKGVGYYLDPRGTRKPPSLDDGPRKSKSRKPKASPSRSRSPTKKRSSSRKSRRRGRSTSSSSSSSGRSSSASPRRGRRRGGRRRRHSSSDSSSSSNSDRSRGKSESRNEKKRGETPTTPRGSSETAKDTPQDKAPADGSKPANADPAVVASRFGRTGGVYVPPFKLRQQEFKDKSSVEYQRVTWMALRKGINGLVNKVNIANMKEILPDLFQLNLVRGRGLFARSIMKAQLASPGFTHIYATLVAIVNTKLPENGELILKRVVASFRRSLKRNDKMVATSCVRFIAHLVNRQVANEILALEVLALLLANPTNDSVQIAVEFTKEVGMLLNDLCPKGLHDAFEGFRAILHEGDIDKRVQQMIEGLFAVRKVDFEGYPMVLEELDLIENDDQITHLISLDDDVDKEEMLDVFREDKQYLESEELWKQIKREVLGEEDSDDDSSSSSSGSGSDADSEDNSSSGDDNNEDTNNAQAVGGPISDRTEADLVGLRRTIYLTIMSSANFEECAHKLMKVNIRPGEEVELCKMLIECCSQERTYLKFYGLIGQRFCLVLDVYRDDFEQEFAFQYNNCQRLETNKLRNVAKFFAHLLYTDALPWTVFEHIQLNEDATTSSSRIFVKILMQELAEQLGIKVLKERFMDQQMQDIFKGMFPKDNPRHTRFAINYMTSIGLGGLTDDLRNWLKNAPKMILERQPQSSDDESDSSSSSGSSSSSSSSGSSSSSSSGSSSSSSNGSSSSSGSSRSSRSSSSSDTNSSDSDASGRRRRRRRRRSQRSSSSSSSESVASRKRINSREERDKRRRSRSGESEHSGGTSGDRGRGRGRSEEQGRRRRSPSPRRGEASRKRVRRSGSPAKRERRNASPAKRKGRSVSPTKRERRNASPSKRDDKRTRSTSPVKRADKRARAASRDGEEDKGKGTQAAKRGSDRVVQDSEVDRASRSSERAQATRDAKDTTTGRVDGNTDRNRDKASLNDKAPSNEGAGQAEDRGASGVQKSEEGTQKRKEEGTRSEKTGASGSPSRRARRRSGSPERGSRKRRMRSSSRGRGGRGKRRARSSSRRRGR